MKLATAAELREMDRKAGEAYGVSEIALMENAGAAVAESVEALLDGCAGKKICIFAGAGNNGGDGFVAARHLMARGGQVKVFLLGDAAKLPAAAQANLEILQRMDAPVRQIAGERDWDKAKIAAAFADCIVDALLGTGVRGELRPEAKRLVRLVNEARRPVVAVDLPSGVQADTGAVFSEAIRADRTVTFALAKPGLFFYPGAAHAGEISVHPIGMPKDLLESAHIKQNLADTTSVKRLLPERPPHIHKGEAGKVLVVAGSRGMTGAAVLASQAALRGGAGVVTLAAAESLHDILEVKLTEVMTRPLPEAKPGVLGPQALEELLALASGYGVAVVGPGLGRDAATARLVREFVAAADCRFVIDADALHAFDGDAEALRAAKQPPVLTPHLGEMAALLGVSVAEIECDLLAAARRAAGELRAVVTLKSARTVVARPEGDAFVNALGNAGMATAGAGDVLAGAIASLWAQGCDGFHAAVAGVHLHSLAGDLAAGRGMEGLVAGDIARELPAARQSAAAVR